MYTLNESTTSYKDATTLYEDLATLFKDVIISQIDITS